jgi:FMN-dependent NADH-azoreductase
MSTLLVITSSLGGATSQSSRLADRYVERLKASDPELTVVRRDLSRDPVAPLDGARLQAFGTAPGDRSPEQARMVAESDALIGELKAADVVLIASPMYNFGVPSQLKNWFDQVARAGITFRYTATGPEGLLGGRRAVLVTTRGGRHRGLPHDHVVPYVETMLRFIGIGAPEVVYAEGLAISADERARALEAAEARIDAITALAA